DVATARLVLEEHLGGNAVLGWIAFSPDAKSHLLAIACDQAVHLWDLDRRRVARKIAIEQGLSLSGLAFSPDGTTLAAGMGTVGAEAELRVWRVGDGSVLRRLTSKKNAAVSDVAFSSDGRILAATGRQGRLLLFDVATGKEMDALANVRLASGPLSIS